ncbi:hypothetical protein L6E10_05955 [Lentzea sp. CC55]|nr:hypothetical protein [Lentzea sp. CC55]MCG8921965.1 hypothetical protein [Lentzea sp. CC55]
MGVAVLRRAVAPREGAALVSRHQQAADGGGERSGLAAYVHRFGAAAQHHRDHARVAGEAADQGGRDGDAVVERREARPRRQGLVRHRHGEGDRLAAVLGQEIGAQHQVDQVGERVAFPLAARTRVHALLRSGRAGLGQRVDHRLELRAGDLVELGRHLQPVALPLRAQPVDRRHLLGGARILVLPVEPVRELLAERAHRGGLVPRRELDHGPLGLGRQLLHHLGDRRDVLTGEHPLRHRRGGGRQLRLQRRARRRDLPSQLGGAGHPLPRGPQVPPHGMAQHLRHSPTAQFGRGATPVQFSDLLHHRILENANSHHITDDRIQQFVGGQEAEVRFAHAFDRTARSHRKSTSEHTRSSEQPGQTL